MAEKDLPAGAKAKAPPRPRRKAPVVAAAPEAPVETVPAEPEAVKDEMPVAEPVAVVKEDPIEAAVSPAPDVHSTEAVTATLPATKEGIPDMATVTSPTAATEKAQAMFGDMSARFKGAFEKSSKMGEEMVEFTKGNVEAFVASARVAAKGGEALGQEAAEYSKKSFESAMAMFKSFAAVKSPTELFQLQSDYAKASFDSAVAEASKFSEAMLKIAGEVAQPLSSRYAVAAEKIKSATL